MSAISLRAHFDGEKILLDDPVVLEPNTKLIITVLPKEKFDEEQNDWLRFSLQNLENAYGEDEIEYPLSLIKEPNPDYEGR